MNASATVDQRGAQAQSSPPSRPPAGHEGLDVWSTPAPGQSTAGAGHQGGYRPRSNNGRRAARIGSAEPCA